jgi:HK97 family phage major capsid protein
VLARVQVVATLSRTAYVTELVEVMKPLAACLGTATVLRTASGNPLPVPTMDDTGNEGAIVAENGSLSRSQDAVLGQITLGAFKFSSKMVPVSYELLQDSAAITLEDAGGSGIENLIRDITAERLGRIIDHKCMTGVGTTEPFGLLATVATGKTGLAGQTTSIIYDDVIDLIHSVDKAYRPAARFVANDLTIAALAKLKDTQGHPLWQPSLQAGQPDILLGYPVDTNNYVPTMAVSAKSLIFGDIRKYYIRVVDEVISMRLVERYADLGQVAFFTLMRADGHLMDTSAIKVYANSAT